jgi:transcriptional regulator with XRE-family HTH domain
MTDAYTPIMEAELGKGRPRRANELGATGRTVAENVIRLRSGLGLTTAELAQRLTNAGRTMRATTITKIETQQRRVDADDLVALAVAFGVNVSALILPMDVEPTDEVEVTGMGAVPASEAWFWADGHPPPVTILRANFSELAVGREMYRARKQFELYGRPHWLSQDPDDVE